MLQNKFFRICIGIILVLVIFNLMNMVGFLFTPLLVMLQTLFVPILISGFLYYMLRPLVNFLEKKGIGRGVGTLLIYFVITSIVGLFIVAFGPMLQTQIENFMANAPELVESTRVQIEKLQQNRLLAAYFTKDQGDISTKISEYINSAINYATAYLSDTMSFLTSILLIITTIPIILYYLLISGHKAMDNAVSMLPKSYTYVAKETLEEIDSVLSGYIIGRIIICICLGIPVYLGFLWIGLPYPLLLAIIIAVTNLIPFIGPIIGAVPALIVAFTQSYPMMMWVALLIIVAQQLDDTILAPQVFGKKMDVHPLTIVLLLLVGEKLAGILGMLLAIPLYMVLKIILLRINRLFVFRYE
ncbi:AI-2E family transporter [Paenibacillus sp. S3N08]|uniref:AI-2E family transporter n=1 Tax=Paenibacillus agricola TaxID=2716264 RepID=A0ABX0J9Y8_9BACL|nr:AI-2E family transporter [Paenibacillus agricola]